MSLIVGLGNIGEKYEGTRHNIGFEIVDALAETLSITFGPGDGPFVVAEGRHRGRNVVLIKPTTYMNKSGMAVKKALSKYKADQQDCLVIYDDLNLDVGDIRLRASGSAGGHNGIQHIIDQLGNRDFPRLRFGIGNDFPRGRQVDFVLSPFSNSDQPYLEEGIQKAHDAALYFVREGINKTMNNFN
ncbi:aminoacyl-tRNA hydrolase [Gracilimonas tropica]|uniref:aminoacyl-tRNA hydrolase n=1 Tax=Gracilimonas tropica TaxID=454600 RepID=UPI00036621B1|nr:aminoacyl-tRNA hydrolase [Gracilimonas tropica]